MAMNQQPDEEALTTKSQKNLFLKGLGLSQGHMKE